MSGLHQLLAVASLVVMLVALLDGVVRAWRSTAPGALAARVNAAVLLLLGMTIAGGLGLLIGGNRPQERLHLMYAILAFAALPVANALATGAKPRRCALVTVVGALFALIVIWRLFATG